MLVITYFNPLYIEVRVAEDRYVQKEGEDFNPLYIEVKNMTEPVLCIYGSN